MLMSFSFSNITYKRMEKPTLVGLLFRCFSLSHCRSLFLDVGKLGVAANYGKYSSSSRRSSRSSTKKRRIITTKVMNADEKEDEIHRMYSIGMVPLGKVSFKTFSVSIRCLGRFLLPPASSFFFFFFFFQLLFLLYIVFNENICRHCHCS